MTVASTPVPVVLLPPPPLLLFEPRLARCRVVACRVETEETTGIGLKSRCGTVPIADAVAASAVSLEATGAETSARLRRSHVESQENVKPVVSEAPVAM